MTTITICLIMYTLYKMIPDAMKQAADEVDVAKQEQREPTAWHYAVSVALILILTNIL